MPYSLKQREGHGFSHAIQSFKQREGHGFSHAIQPKIGAALAAEVNREAAKESSPRRKAWVSSTDEDKPRRGERRMK